MKKRILAALILCLALLGGACSGMKAPSVESLLTAPLLTDDQLAVRDALEAYTRESAALKYPLSGDRRAPIQFVDLDGDGKNEVTVFFSTSDSPIAKLAVLNKNVDGGWAVVSEIKGLDTDVESVNYLKVANNNGRWILVEWSSSDKRERKTITYRLEDGELKPGLEKNTIKQLVYDIDGDGYEDIMYITGTGQGTGFELKYADLSAGSEQVETPGISLNPDMNGCLGLTAGQLDDGQRAVFVDESVPAGEELEPKQITEVFTFRAGSFSPAESDLKIIDLSRRAAAAPGCRKLQGSEKIYIPSEYHPNKNGNVSANWLYWYTIGDGKTRFEAATYVDQSYDFALGVPEAWLDSVDVDNEAERVWAIYGLGVERVPVITLRVLVIGESDEQYLAEGYEQLRQVGTNRFFIKPYEGVTDEDYAYIKHNFFIL